MAASRHTFIMMIVSMESLMPLTRDFVLGRPQHIEKIKVKEEYFPETYLRVLSIDELDRWEEQKKDTKLILAMSLTDESGARLFTDAQASEIGTIHWKVIDQLFDKIVDLNGLRRDPKALETAAKN